MFSFSFMRFKAANKEVTILLDWKNMGYIEPNVFSNTPKLVIKHFRFELSNLHPLIMIH